MELNSTTEKRKSAYEFFKGISPDMENILDDIETCLAENEKLRAVVDCARNLVGGWDFNHLGWEVSAKDLQAVQDAIASLDGKRNAT